MDSPGRPVVTAQEGQEKRCRHGRWGEAGGEPESGELG